jgi:hypothetical protein
LDRTRLQNQQQVTSIDLPLLADEVGAVYPNNPTWLEDAVHRLELTALVVDYFPDSNAPSTRLHEYLQHLCFDSFLDTSQRQRGVSCGIVAARVACDLKDAGELFQVDDNHHRAVSPQVLWSANKILVEKWRTFTRNPLNSGQLSVINRVSKNPRDSNATCFLSDSDIYFLVNSWRQQRAGFSRFGQGVEEPGPPCFRCDGNHMTKDCASYPHPRFIDDCTKWLATVSIDQCLREITDDLRKACRAAWKEPDSPAQVKILVVNNSAAGQGVGTHWFTVAYYIRQSGQ